MSARIMRSFAACVVSVVATLLPAGGALQAQFVPRAPERAARPAVAAYADTLTSSFTVDGIPVLLRRVTANNVVAANVYLLGGTRQLTPATQGIELLLLEASEKGTAKYPRERLRARMAEMGSAVGVSPGVDWSVLGLRSTVAQFDSTWAILADRLIAPRLDSADVELVREQVRSAVGQRDESPDALLDWMADSAGFAGHPYALSPVGTVASLGAITRDDLRAYHRAQVVRSRLFVVVVGNVTRERVERLVRGTLGTLPAGDYTWSLPDPPAPRASGAAFAQRRLPTNYVQGWFVGPRADDDDYAALRLACAVLSGRLFTEIRERRNLTYAVDAPFRERAIAMGGLYVTTTQPDAVLEIMQREMRALQQGTISQAGLDRLVQQFIVTYFLDNETNADQANLLARAALYQGDWRRANSFVDDLRAVTPEDIRLAAVKYFREVRWAFVGDALRVDRRAFERF
jgi:zinc protease